MRLAAITTAAALACTAALAGPDRIEWTFSHSITGPLVAFVELRLTDEDGAVAEVEFQNRIAHEASETFLLHIDGLTVFFDLRYQCDGNAECLYILPPEGFYAIPDMIKAFEGQNIRALIYADPGAVS